MKKLPLIAFVSLVVLVQTETQAQTASNTSIDKYYSTLVKEKIQAGQHPAPANGAARLPGGKELPLKVKELANQTHPETDNNPNRKLPGDAAVNVDGVTSRNQKWINRKESL